MKQGCGLPIWMILSAAGASALPAVAQVPATAQVSATARVPDAAPSTLTAPDSLPSLPVSGYGVGGALSPATAVNPDLVHAPPAPSISLSVPGAGVTTLQQGDPRTPAYLIRPRITVGETLTDNVRLTPKNRVADFETQLSPGLSISADTPRFRGILDANLEYDKFVFAPDQDRLFLSLYGNGTVTAIPDMLFVDVQANRSQASLVGSAGFASVSQQSKNSTTPVTVASISPYLRRSYAGLVDSELRYRFGTTSSAGGGFGNNALTTPILQTSSALADSSLNQGTLTVATGRDFEKLLSRLTLDVSKVDSSSVAANSRSTAYNDIEYRFTSGVAALGRLGYENIRYRDAPDATTAGIAWQIGGRLNFGNDTDYATLRYGKQEGIYGFSGAAHYQITPATALTMAGGNSLGSLQDLATNTLTQSSLDPYGRIVDQFGLPTAFVNPSFSLLNDVVRSKSYRVDLTTTIGVNRLSLFGTFDRRTSLGTTAPPSPSIGVHFLWAREVRPDLTANFAVGFVNTKNLAVMPVSSAPVTTTLIDNTNTATADLNLQYLFNETLTGSATYSLVYQTNGPSISSANVVTVGNILTNRLIFSLTKTF